MKFRTPEELMHDNMLVKHYAGSIAYGTNLPTSDVDFRGVFAGDPVNVRTPFYTVRETTDVNEEDTKFYELAHFMKLCVDCNPNIVETLWVDEKDITFSTPAYELLREHRHELLSSKIAFTTSGYAIAQLKRIKGHNKWITNPQSEEPPRQTDFVSLVQWFGNEKRLKFSLEDFKNNHRLIPYGSNIYGLVEWDHHHPYALGGTLNTTFEKPEHINKNWFYWLGVHSFETSARKMPIAVVKFNKEVYNEAKEKHKQYWSWKDNRNEARSELEEQFGYDTKHAMHLVRLLRMGVEALRDGEIVVKRPDAEELLNIRNGAWTYEEVLEYAEEMDREVREVWYKKTELRKKVDLKKAASILMEVQDLVWSK